MLRKILAICLALALVCTMAACGGTSSAPSPSAAEITITGVVMDATMNAITMKTSDGIQYTFATEGAKVEMKDGLLLGDTVAITYTGDIKDGDTTGATVTIVRDGADNSKNPLRLQVSSSAASSTPASSATEAEQTISGTVTAAGMSAITIKTAEGTELSFAMDGIESTLEKGPVVGDKVTLAYTGTITDTDTSNAVAVRLSAAE